MVNEEWSSVAVAQFNIIPPRKNPEIVFPV